MVQRARKIIWSVNAQAIKKSIFFYWNNRNKSTTYSERLELIFKETLKRVAIFSNGSLATNNMNVRFVLTGDYYLIFEITDTAIIVLDIWDTR